MFSLFRKLLLIALFISSFVWYGQSAQAITIDYADLANGICGNVDSANGCGEGGYEPLIVVEEGITVTATSPSGVNDYPYLDSYWSGHGDAGLGVCQFLNAEGECVPGNDDNLTHNGHKEELVLNFSEEVTITEILIRNGDHGTDFEDSFTINGTDYLLVHIFNTPLTSSEFVFSIPAQNSGGVNENVLAQMYIEAITFQVPEPSTLLLLGSGLVAIGLLRRKKKLD